MSGLTEFLPDGVMSARLAPERARSLNAHAFRQRLERVLPGVYALPHVASSPEGRLRAVGAYGTDLVVTRHAAAALTWWEDLALPETWELACPRPISPGYGMAVEQRVIPVQLTTRLAGAAITVPELTVLDLIPDLDDAVVYEALRRKKVTIGTLQRALRLTPKRRGNKRRRDILKACEQQPWSFLEKEGHGILRGHDITGWVANYRISIQGVTYYLDAAFRREKVAVEFDGFAYHSSAESFHGDRDRDADLASIGWLPVHFTDKTIGRVGTLLPQILAERRALLSLG
ncbi:hypothetical protein [Tessaracoccus sp. MC1756]|uniref:hypothetical protein n=1 Tax=Tessaracoccus sp. MC1756 TaxID=2760311 RepID=UPI0015FF63AF|nr:hypothetical protein [Tessaracoccus sp. MC1756]MBB1509499.1 hypothetical protein [Tessaracoccus sp. MC1756]